MRDYSISELRTFSESYGKMIGQSSDNSIQRESNDIMSVNAVGGNGIAFPLHAIYFDDLSDDQIELAFRGLKKYETRRTPLSSRLIGRKVGILSNKGSVNGRKNILRGFIRLGNGVLCGKDSEEYSQSCIEGTPFDIKTEDGKKWFYPILDIEETTPIDVRGHVVNSPRYGLIDGEIMN